VKDVDRALALTPKQPLALFYRGSFRVERGEDEAAMADFTEESPSLRRGIASARIAEAPAR